MNSVQSESTHQFCLWEADKTRLSVRFVNSYILISFQSNALSDVRTFLFEQVAATHKVHRNEAQSVIQSRLWKMIHFLVKKGNC